MNIENRLAKLEASSVYRTPCLCGKSFVDLVYGIPGESVLMPCRKCEQQFAFWENLAAEAGQSENLTDLETT